MVKPQERKDYGSLSLAGLHEAAVILERMVIQNLYDDIVQGTFVAEGMCDVIKQDDLKEINVICCLKYDSVDRHKRRHYLR